MLIVELLESAAKPLYVKRQLLNANEVHAWAKEQGFNSVLPGKDMHVTILFSKKPVALSVADTRITNNLVVPDGARLIKRLGAAVTMVFQSAAIVSRHRELIANGGSSSFSHFMPHITLTYEGEPNTPLREIVPFRGDLIFGPEEFEPLNPSWRPQAEVPLNVVQATATA